MARNRQRGFQVNSGYSLDVFSDKDFERIHKASLELLEFVGMKYESEEALDIMEAGGAEVNRETGVAKIPGWMVEDAIHTAPSKMLFAGKTPEYDMLIEQDRVYNTIMGIAVYIADPKTQEIRLSVKQDVADCARLVDYLDEYDYLYPSATSGDVDPRVEPVHSFEAAFVNTYKHVLSAPLDLEQTRACIRMAEVYLGGKHTLRERPIVSAGFSTISPFKIDQCGCDMIIECSRVGIPVMDFIQGLCGGTSAITPAAAVAQNNAEVLGALVLHQLVHKGSPFIPNTSTTILQMSNTQVSIGCPEMAVMNAAISHMFNRYGMPCICSGG
jgi:trimethylamine--corrinoid protein Co-methyltransferase